MDKDKIPQWIPLADLRAGAIFETLEGWRGVKGVKVHQGQLHCTGLKDGVGVYRGGQVLVREIIIKDGLKAFTVKVPCYLYTIITAATSRDSARMQTMETLRGDRDAPTWVEVRVLRAPEYDRLAKRAYKEHLALGEINTQTGEVRIYDWIETERELP